MHNGNPVVKQWLYDWNSLCQLADARRVTGHQSNRKELLERIERSPPIPLFTSEGTVWIIIKVFYHKIEKRKYLEVRAYEKVYYGDHEKPKAYFRKTDMGINLPLRRWVDAYHQIIKYLEKYRKDI